MEVSLKKMLSVLTAIIMLFSSCTAFAEEGADGFTAAETAVMDSLNPDGAVSDAAGQGEKAPEHVPEDEVVQADTGSDANQPESGEESTDATESADKGNPALFGVAVVDTIEQPEEPELTEHTIAVTLFADSSAAHQSNEPAVPTKNLLKGMKNTLAAPQTADGKAADGNAPDGEVADGKAPDGKAADGKADDGETTISITGELPEGAYAIGWPVDIGDVITEELEDGLTREAEVLGAYQLELYNADGTKIESTDTPVTVNLNLAPKAAKGRPQEPDKVGAVPLSSDGKADTSSPMETRSSGNNVSVTTSILDGLALLFNWNYTSRHMRFAYTAAEGLSTWDRIAAEVLIDLQWMWYTNAICPEGQTMLEAVKMSRRDPRIVAHILITDLPAEGTWNLYSIIDDQGHLSEEAIREDVKVADLIDTTANVYGYALVGNGAASEQTLSTEDPNGSYRVTVRYDSTTGIPMRGTRLEVVEIDRESDQYETCYALASEALNGMEEGRLFEIRIVDEETGEVLYEPDEGTLVDVLIELLKTNYRAGKESHIVHLLADNTVEELQVVATPNGRDYAYSFRTGSFSPFMVSYTVDFYYNGYEYSIPGDSGILLSELFEELDINVPAADVANVSFTDKSLVSVEGEGQDWRLTSIKPFDTEETLTVTLTDGDRIEIRVLDAQVPEAQANFKVINRSNGLANQQTITYWENFGEAVAQADISASNYPAKIEVLKDVTITDTSVYSKGQPLTIEGNNHTITRGAGLTGDIISMSSGTAGLTISNLTIDGNEEINATGALIRRTINNTMTLMKLDHVTLYGGKTSNSLIQVDNSVSNRRAVQVELNGCEILLEDSAGSALSIHQNTSNGTNSIRIINTKITGPGTAAGTSGALINNPGNANLFIQDGSEIYRGSSNDSAISNTGSGSLTINRSLISGAKSAADSASVSANKPLIKQGSGAITLTDATIEKHEASNNSYAVDASQTDIVNVSGSTTITGNKKSGDKEANLYVKSIVTQTGNLTGGIIGFTSYDNGYNIEQADFAETAATYNGYSNFNNDSDPTLIPKLARKNNRMYLRWSKDDNKKFYITDNTRVSYYSTLQEAFNAAANNATIYSLVEVYEPSTTETNSKDNITIQPGAYNHLTIRRAEGITGVLLASQKNLILNGVILDGNNKEATDSLLKMTGNATLTLTDVTVQNHTASNTSCAVDAYNASHVYLSGATKITGNTANGYPANLRIPDYMGDGAGYRETEITGSLTENIGITSNDNIDQGQFAYIDTNITGLEHLSADNNEFLVAQKSGSHAVIWNWPGSTNGSGDGSDQAQPPRPAADFTGYPNQTAPTREHDTSIPVPLTKYLNLNQNASSLTIAETAALSPLEFTFTIEGDSGNPADGAVIRNSGNTETNEYSFRVGDTWAAGEKSGRKVTWSISNAWNIVFSKPGTYAFTVTENDPESGIGYTTANVSTTLTYYVVEEEGVLRIAEAYRDGEAVILPEQAGDPQQAFSTGGLFYVSRDVDGNGRVGVSQIGSAITMELSQYGADHTFGAITTEFSFDFSRSFVVSGTMQMVKEDGMSFAFHTNKRVKIQKQEGAYGVDDGYFGTGNGYVNQESFLKTGSSANGGGAVTRFVTASTLGRGFLFVMFNEPLSGMGSFLMNGLNRTPYSADSGLASGHYEILTLSNGNVAGGNIDNRTVYYNYSDTLPYSIRFDCSNHDTGLGTLTIQAVNKTIVYNNFNASSIFGNGWREVFFTLGACEDNHATAMMSLTDFRYLDGIRSADVSFWADRDGDNVFETQVNITNSPAVPGETILVRHELVADQTGGYDHNFYVKTLITQLKNITDGTNLTGIDRTAVSWNGSNTALGALDESTDAFNTYTLSDGMYVTVLSGEETTYFDYKLTAPAGFDQIVAESATFGEPPFPYIATQTYGFRTQSQLEWETPTFTNTADIYHVTYDPAGGQLDNAATNKVIAALNGTTFTVSEVPTRDGYLFTGWKPDESTTYQDGSTFTVTEDVTLTAQWVECVEIEVHILEKTSGTPINHDAEWRKDPHVIVLAKNEPLTGAEVREAALAFIREDVTYGTSGKPVTECISGNNIYGRTGGTDIELTDSLNLTYDGTSVKIGNSVISPNEINLVLIFGHDLTVAKTVSGAMGDQTKPFTVYVRSAALTAGDVYYDNQATPDSYTVGADGIELSLRHGQAITLKQLPEGNYTIIEAATGESYTVTYTGAADTDNTSEGLQFVLDDDKSITVNNDLGVISPTGIELKYAPYLLILLCGAALMLLSRKKRRA